MIIFFCITLHFIINNISKYKYIVINKIFEYIIIFLFDNENFNYAHFLNN